MWIRPDPEQLQALAQSPEDGPILMLNLLRFKPSAEGIDTGATGAEAYARYSVAAEPFLRAVGGRLRAVLEPRQSVIGPADREWDLVLLVEYPSRQKFLEMAANPDYQSVHAHRDAALADSRLIACSDLADSTLRDLH